MPINKPLTFTKARDRYLCIVNRDTIRWPIHLEKRHNDTWKATIYREPTEHTRDAIIFREIGRTRQKVAEEAAEWLLENLDNLYLQAVCHDIEVKVVGDIIHRDDHQALSLLMGEKATIRRDKDGNVTGIEVEKEITLEDEEDPFEEDDTDEPV